MSLKLHRTSNPCKTQFTLKIGWFDEKKHQEEREVCKIVLYFNFLPNFGFSLGCKKWVGLRNLRIRKIVVRLFYLFFWNNMLSFNQAYISLQTKLLWQSLVVCLIDSPHSICNIKVVQSVNRINWKYKFRINCKENNFV